MGLSGKKKLAKIIGFFQKPCTFLPAQYHAIGGEFCETPGGKNITKHPVYYFSFLEGGLSKMHSTAQYVCKVKFIIYKFHQKGT